jgi:hypothetical protein
MPLDELEQLPDLVGLGLPVDVLEVDQLADRWMDVDVVASADAGKAESESLGQGASISEAEVVRGRDVPVLSRMAAPKMMRTHQLRL